MKKIWLVRIQRDEGPLFRSEIGQGFVAAFVPEDFRPLTLKENKEDLNQMLYQVCLHGKTSNVEKKEISLQFAIPCHKQMPTQIREITAGSPLSNIAK
ncbi:hypothetical protein C0Q70_21738 [Pomacea canaliculata]|uniref:Uncharacterized protein n=1 Tax=Pomacea canaliculata TaxID=400727 RepID=A0A2T7NDC9_POMCA|nr:hypothetical protein C0Q70_21738 [Pomacea canaliculata]